MTEHTAASVSAALGGRKQGKGYRCQCPAHPDKDPSLDVRDGDNGVVLVICRAGCTQEAVLTALREQHNIKLFSGDSAAPPREQVPAGWLRPKGISEFLKRPPLRWLIKGALPSCGIGTLIGPPNSGKTFVWLYLVQCFLRGVPWFGHKVKEAGGVVAIQAEGVAGLSNRLRAAMQANPDTDWTLLRIIDHPVNLIDPAQVTALISWIESESRMWAPVRILIIDTLNATMAEGDENTSEGMGAYKRAALQIATTCNLFVLVVHHTGKDPERGARGHSSLLGAVDVELLVAPEMEPDPDDESKYPRKVPTGRRYIRGTKMRDGELMSDHFFKLQVVQLGKDEDGDPVTSCVVQPSGWVE